MLKRIVAFCLLLVCVFGAVSCYNTPPVQQPPNESSGNSGNVNQTPGENEENKEPALDNKDDNKDEEKEEPIIPTEILLSEFGDTDFKVVLPKRYKGTMVEDAALDFVNNFYEKTGAEIELVSDDAPKSASEILIGLAPTIASINATSGLEKRDYRIKTVSGKILITGGSLYSICLALEDFYNHIQTKTGCYTMSYEYDYTYTYSKDNSESVYGTLDEKRAQYANPLGRPMVAAHRSEHVYSTENSIAGIISATELGVDIIEIDLQKTKDGHYILCHDTTLTSSTNVSELAGKNGLPESHAVSDWTLEQIMQLTLKGSILGERPVLLEDVFKIVKGKTIVVLDKIKSDEDAIAVYEIAVKMRAVDSIAFQFTNSFAALEKAYEETGIPIMYMHWQNTIESAADFVTSGRYVERAYALQAIQTTVNETTVDKSLTDVVRTKCRIYANTLWTTGLSSDTPKTWNTLYESGVTIIQTDDPFAVVALARYLTFGIKYEITYTESPVLKGTVATITIDTSVEGGYFFGIEEGKESNRKYSQPIVVKESSVIRLIRVINDGKDRITISFKVLVYSPEYYEMIGISA